MSYCTNNQIQELNINIPTFPEEDNCVVNDENGTQIYLNSGQSSRIAREELLRNYEIEFNRILNDTTSRYDKHARINCFLGKMLENIEANYRFINSNSRDIDTLLENEKKFLEDQKNVLQSNENSDLVAKYRNESSEKRTQKSKTKFTIFVSVIVVFLILEGIIFFV